MTDHTMRKTGNVIEPCVAETTTYVNSVFTNLFKGNMFLVDMLAARKNSGDGVNAVLSYRIRDLRNHNSDTDDNVD